MTKPDLVQIVMTRRAALTISNLAGLGYYYALAAAGVPVDAEVFALSERHAIEMLRKDVAGNATRDELQDAFKTLGAIPVKDGDNIIGSVTVSRHGMNGG